MPENNKPVADNKQPVDDNKQALEIAKRIAKNIHGHKASGGEAYVVSVYGEWGVGKTKCLRDIEKLFKDKLISPEKGLEIKPGFLYEENQQENQKASPPNPLVIPVFFSAWMYEKEPHLIVPLLKTIENSLVEYDESNPSKIKTGIEEKIKKVNSFSKLFSLKHKNELKIDWLSIVNTIAGPVIKNSGIPAAELLYTAFEKIIKSKSVTLNTTSESDSKTDEVVEDKKPAVEGENTEVELTTEESLYYNFHFELTKLLKEPIGNQDKNDEKQVLRFVVLVDDLDRCLPEKAIEMLESIKLFMNVGGFSFVLAVDDDIVERGIRHRYAAYMTDEYKLAESNKEKPRNAPITGHEYLEKIVHLPQHLNRWNEEQVKKFLSDKTAEYTVFNETGVFDDQVKALVSLITRVVPKVPRKLIRLSESLEFQYQALLAQCDGEDDKDRLHKWWRPVIAARAIILAQLYPEVYRILRQGKPRQFWEMMFSVCKLKSGKIGFSNALQFYLDKAELLKNQPARNNSAESLHDEELANTKNKKGNGAEKVVQTWEMEDLKLALAGDTKNGELKELCDWLRISKENTSEEKTSKDDNSETSDKKTWQWAFDAQMLYDFIKAVNEACNSRNGLGILHLWDDDYEEKAKILEGGNSATNQFVRIITGFTDSDLKIILMLRITILQTAMVMMFMLDYICIKILKL